MHVFLKLWKSQRENHSKSSSIVRSFGLTYNSVFMTVELHALFSNHEIFKGRVLSVLLVFIGMANIKIKACWLGLKIMKAVFGGSWYNQIIII